MIFSTRNLLIQRLLRYAVGTVYVLNIGFWRSPTIVFEVGFVKSDSKTCELVPTRPACCDCKLENFLSKKITARFKLNLKTDGPDCKIIFKFGSRVERLHSARKQGRRIYNVCICKQCVCLYKHHLRCKILVGNTQTLELHPVDAGCFKQIKRKTVLLLLEFPIQPLCQS